MMESTSADHTEHGHETGHGHSAPRPFRRLRQFLLPERGDLMLVALFAFAVALLSLATPIAVESLVNTVSFGVLMWPVLVIAGIVLTCLGFAAVIRAMQVYIVECVQRRLFVRVVADYAHRFPRLNVESFDRQYGPELANRFFDVLNLQKSFAFLCLDGVSLVVTALVGMVVLAFYHPFLLGFDILLILLIAFLFFVLGWGGVRSSIHESHAKYDVAAWLQELLRSPRAFRFGSGRQLALEQAERLSGEYLSARRLHFRVVWRQTLFALGLQVVASTALLGIGGYIVINRQLTLGQLVAAELIVTLIVSSVAKLGKYAESYYDLLTGAEKLGLLTDVPVERTGGEPLPIRDGGIAVSVRGVRGTPHHPLPTPADWQLASRERVAIVGPPGCDATILFEMICGLRVPSHGVIEIDGIDLRGLSLDSVREQIALVDGTEIVTGTVVDNVRLGRPNVTPADVRQVLQVVGLTTAVQQLPLGDDTPLISGGGQLSASEIRRLCIARALVGRPRLLILDGVLDTLDRRDCPDLLTHLFDRAAPWTLLIASTHPNVVGLCDRIVGWNAEPVGVHHD